VDSIDPIDERGDEAKASEEVSSGFVVAGCNGPKIFQAAERSFDNVAQAIKSGVEWEELLAVDFVRNSRHRAASLQEETQMNQKRQVARELVIRLIDRRVLSAWECCDDCIDRALVSLQEIRQILVDKQVALSDMPEGPLYLLIGARPCGHRS
jgi:hypothetical protein